MKEKYEVIVKTSIEDAPQGHEKHKRRARY